MTNDPLHRHLASSTLFQDVPVELLAALEPSLEAIEVDAGDELLRQGEPGDAMYVLIDGELDVHVRTPGEGSVTLDRLARGATVGEMALVVAQKRSATVTARAPSRLVRLSRADFERLAQDQPDLYEAVVRQAAPRLQRVQLGHVLESWFAALDPTEIRELQERVHWIRLTAGQTLYAEGDPADGMYLVVSGRMRLIRSRHDGSDEVVADVGRGAGLGEYGLVSEAPRSERALALRDTHVVWLSRDLVDHHPRMLVQVARSIAERTRSAQRPMRRLSTFALVPHDAGSPAAGIADALASELRAWGNVLVLDAAAVERAVGRQGAAQAPHDSVFDPSLTHWLNEREVEHAFLVLVCEARDSPWTRRALRQADVALVVAEAGSDPSVREHERVAQSLCRDVQLALVHPPDAERPQRTMRWIEPRDRPAFHHLRLGYAPDLGRLARRLVGRANGLVFSGGGARGYVHIGLIRALLEAGTPIDAIGGTSMGAVVGGALALTHSYEFCYSAAASFGDPKKLLDRTLPIVALNRSRAVTELYHTMFGDVRIEDLWTPFLCVSANLTRAEPVVHETGPLWEAVRASSAIPGVFTPVMLDGDLLVDGGVMNNFPVDLMRERVRGGTVIGSNAYTQNAQPQPYDLGTSVSGWGVLRQKLLPLGRKKRYPSMLSTLMRATSLSSKHLGEAAFSLADLTIRYPVEDYGTLDFGHYDELIEIGYRQARDVLQPWLQALASDEKASQAA